MSDMLRNITFVETEKRQCIFSKLIIRGVQEDISKKIPKLVNRWNTKVGRPMEEDNVELSYLYSIDMNDKRRSIDACYNSKSILDYLEPIKAKSNLLYQKKGYLHWYRKYCRGDLEELFDASLESLNTVCDSYSGLDDCL
jgi:hypothetical protein